MKRLLLAAILFAAVFTLPMQADFIQCVAGVACPLGTANADLMNGSPGDDDMNGLLGNDQMFGGDGNDAMVGWEGDDFIVGGNGRDLMNGNQGNDTFLPGPDDLDGIQLSAGGLGNDTFIVLVGETANCQYIVGNLDIGGGSQGFDVLHLIGFGPYSSEYPYGAPEPIAPDSWIVVQDDVAGGYIFVEVEYINVGSGIERINGLASPNVTVLNDEAASQFALQNCTFLD